MVVVMREEHHATERFPFSVFRLPNTGIPNPTKSREAGRIEVDTGVGRPGSKRRDAAFSRLLWTKNGKRRTENALILG